MECEELLAALNEYVDGDVDSAICEAFAEHLKDCNPCQVVVDNVRQTITLFKAGVRVEMPAELHEELRRQLRNRWKTKFPSQST
jgi:anti-sigma factor RsiW